MENPLRQTIVRHVLPHVREPAAYIGGEWNQIRKDHAAADLRVCLAFPDAYAIGMSHLGLHVLYGTINARPDALAERAFAPWPDMEQLLAQRGLPLYSLESFTPLSEFDILGFSLQYEMCLANVLTMLKLGGIPIRAAERGVSDTLVIAGGPLALAPEPMADFIDLFVLGDGEETIHRLLDALRETRRPTPPDRETLLRGIVSRCPHVYAPALYEIKHHPDGRVESIRPRFPEAPQCIEAAAIKDLDAAYYPTRPIVPFVEIVHERVTLEIMRGCPHRCRYCSAGWTRAPLRHRSLEKLIEQAQQAQAATGYSEISLAGLSSSDYPNLGELVQQLNAYFAPKSVNLSLPSLRVDKKIVALPPLLNVVRRSGLTLAPEAGSERLRRIIGKDITDNALYESVAEAFNAGWTHVKLYFMIGLPGERDEDLDALENIVWRIVQLGRRAKRRGGANVTVAPFVPKAHTPFQWAAMAGEERLRRIRERLTRNLRHRAINVKVHRIERSLMEGVLARGDRRLGAVIQRAWELGCRFDAWDEHFDAAKWKQALADTALDPAFYAHRQRGKDEILPWSHLGCGPSRELLQREWERAASAQSSADETPNISP